MTEFSAVRKWINYFRAHPLALIVLLAIVVRLIAVFFSKGYGMHDDHFDVIEVAQSWVDGQNFFNWFSKTAQENQSGRSFFYPGVHYYLFQFLEFLHIKNPESKMFAVRLLHAALSMLTVVYGYNISLKFSGEKTAKWVGMALALAWFMPFLSVRTLIETVIIGPLCLSVWYLLAENNSRSAVLKFVIAGILMGFCFCTRYQSLIFTGGIWVTLCFQKRFKPALWSFSGFLLAVMLISGYLEYAIWGHPFGKLMFYLRDNFGFFKSSVTDNAMQYDLWGGFNYLLQIMGMFIPPMGVLLFIAQFKVAKKYSILFVPTLLFLVFHILFPNRQERFVFTVLPFMLIMGVAGWIKITEHANFWKMRVTLGKTLTGISVVLNLILLFVFSTFYSKRSKIETMKFLSNDRQLGNIVIETSPFRKSIALPGFYLNGLYPKTFEFRKETNEVDFIRDFSLERRVGKTTYIVFLDSVNINQRVAKLRTAFSVIEPVYTAVPSALDALLYKMNKVNLNQALYIYEANDFVDDRRKRVDIKAEH